MYRRLRYVREYADYQRLQGLQVERKQKQVSEKQQTLLASRKAKEEMLKQGEAERLKLEEQEKERKTLLTSLQKKQRSIQSEISKKRRSADRLNAQIDRLIEIEIENARKRAEEEARRKAEKKAGTVKEKAVATGESKEGAKSKTTPSKWESIKWIQKIVACRASLRKIKVGFRFLLPDLM